MASVSEMGVECGEGEWVLVAGVESCWSRVGVWMVKWSGGKLRVSSMAASKGLRTAGLWMP
eukprot:10083219-Alexandrium_andersonii.AAC.1